MTWGVAVDAAGEEEVDVDADRMRTCWNVLGGSLARAERW